jgi:D-3-phosphoglycerate dehydrogenase / 2-oxoglutarate reductase
MMTSRKCLIIDPMHPSLFRLLKDIGWEYDDRPHIQRQELKALLKQTAYDGMIVRSKTVIDRDLLGDMPALKFIGRAGAGIDNLDQQFLKEKNIQILHAAEGNRDAVGEFTVGILLDLMRNISKGNREVRNKTWNREGNRGEELMGKTVSLIGYGNMGRAFAKRLSGFGCKILAFDKYKIAFSDDCCEESDMERIYAETDILSLHIPLTNETKMMVNRAYLERFKKDILLVNTARGEIAPLADIAYAIETGKLRGAALDVLENEKLETLTPLQQQSFNYLSSKTNVIFTPHIAGWTVESHEKINVALVNKISALKL